MNKLLELTKDFKVSRPVFRLQLSEGDDTINARKQDPLHKYEPKPIEGNFLSELVCESYSENFDSREGSFYINKEDIAKRSMSVIRSSIGKFVEKNLDMRNPRQSKLYRWTYRNMPSNNDFNDTLVMVYNYLRSFTDSDLRSTNTEHTNNGIALLEAIMEKYEK